jgi:hypothetical protein
MLTVRTVIPCPGTFAPNPSETPSSGWTWIASTLGRRPSLCMKIGCGARSNWIAIVVSRFASRFPTRT